MKRAVCILIPKLGSVREHIAVSRRNEPDTCGFPGGKVDPGESELDAIVRETFEEIGLQLVTPELDLVPLYTGLCKGNVNYWVTTFLLVPPINFGLEALKAEEGITLKYADWMDLTNMHKCPFWEYNLRVNLAYGDWLKGQHRPMFEAMSTPDAKL